MIMFVVRFVIELSEISVINSGRRVLMGWGTCSKCFYFSQLRKNENFSCCDRHKVQPAKNVSIIESVNKNRTIL